MPGLTIHIIQAQNLNSESVNKHLCSLKFIHNYYSTTAETAELRFGDRVVRNNSYIRRGDIPGGPGGVNGLLCASDTTNPATRQWYDTYYGDALGTTPPSNGAYQAIDSASGGVLLYVAGSIDTGLHYCRIYDSSGNVQTLYAGLYTNSASEQSGRANG